MIPTQQAPGRADGETPAVEREITLAATPEEVWTAIASEEGRARWLVGEDDRVKVEVAEEPWRVVWWWSVDEGLPTRVELVVRAVPGGSRVRVIETAPSFPIEMLAQALAPVPA
jgi:uncharacterized protein YndB with AHSA1/START domain